MTAWMTDRRWQGNIEGDLRQRGCEDLKWVEIPQDSIHSGLHYKRCWKFGLCYYRVVETCLVSGYWLNGQDLITGRGFGTLLITTHMSRTAWDHPASYSLGTGCIFTWVEIPRTLSRPASHLHCVILRHRYNIIFTEQTWINRKWKRLQGTDEELSSLFSEHGLKIESVKRNLRWAGHVTRTEKQETRCDAYSNSTWKEIVFET
jgi:hypothetical protein